MIQQMLAIWSLVPLPFLNPAWTCGISQLMYCWSLAWRILSITWLVCEMRAIVPYFEHSLALPFFGIGMKTDLFQFCGHCWVFQICWYIDWSTFTASSFSILNSSTGIPSPPLALFIVMLPKAHLSSHFRMSGVITPSWLSGSWRSFLHSSSVYSCLLFSISSASVRSNSFQPPELQHVRLPCPSPSPRPCSSSCPSSWWCHPTISSSVVPFSSCLQFFLVSGSFLMGWLFASGGAHWYASST